MIMLDEGKLRQQTTTQPARALPNGLEAMRPKHDVQGWRKMIRRNGQISQRRYWDRKISAKAPPFIGGNDTVIEALGD